jgi:hypothetical protein
MKKVLIGAICGFAGWIIGRQMLAKQIKDYLDSDEAKQELKEQFDESYSKWGRNREKA